MIEKLVKVIKKNNEEPLRLCFISFSDQTTKELTGMNFPTMNATVKTKVYPSSQLTTKITKALEQEVLTKLLEIADPIYAVDKYPVPLAFYDYIYQADCALYKTTNRLITNTIVCNKSMKSLVKKAHDHKKIIISKFIPDNTVLMLAANDDVNIPGVVVMDDKNYLFDIINPNLVTKILLVHGKDCDAVSTGALN